MKFKNLQIIFNVSIIKIKFKMLFSQKKVKVIKD